ncbi:MAG TPA: (d)CMP kinase [Gammaproteobacteria bacterium]|nr:(d)CMP kinase [Gammaproteobacteria bacterium]
MKGTSDSAPVVAIDGPSGSGKGTIGRLLAQRLGWHYLDTGALYRLVALVALKRHIDFGDAPALARAAATLDVRFAPAAAGERVHLDGVEVGGELRTERTGDAASKVAVVPEVRAALLQRQRDFALPPGLVADGRDVGTVVFPDALLKVVLTASAEARAMRRHKQLKEKGIDVSLPDLSWDIAQRDARDANRTVAPFKPAPDAQVIDSTSLTPEEVVAHILSRLEGVGVVAQRAKK